MRVGKLGVALFPKGTYVYTGSAMGGLAARLKRHLTRKKKIRWHIDHLLKLPEARIDKVIVYPPAAHQECRQNQRIAALLGATVVLQRFGASDCKSGCASHLFFFGSSGFSMKKFSPRRPERSRRDPARLRRNQNEKSRIHHEGTKDTKVFVGCASRTGRSRNIYHKDAKEEHCHFERREKSFLDPSHSLGMTGLGRVA